EALISEVSRIFNVNMSIILANVEILQDMPLGGLLIQASGDPLAVDQAIRYLEERNVKVEVILNGVA
ncbi:MAG: methionine ABC transporter ATP-binding protein, partial [Solobacterium sp.]|nr:methionine ABC transporter ATP-binding protein [Solobacterium sp.]